MFHMYIYCSCGSRGVLTYEQQAAYSGEIMKKAGNLKNELDAGFLSGRKWAAEGCGFIMGTAQFLSA